VSADNGPIAAVREASAAGASGKQPLRAPTARVLQPVTLPSTLRGQPEHRQIRLPRRRTFRRSPTSATTAAHGDGGDEYRTVRIHVLHQLPDQRAGPDSPSRRRKPRRHGPDRCTVRRAATPDPVATLPPPSPPPVARPARCPPSRRIACRRPHCQCRLRHRAVIATRKTPSSCRLFRDGSLLRLRRNVPAAGGCLTVRPPVATTGTRCRMVFHLLNRHHGRSRPSTWRPSRTGRGGNQHVG
jgi:hypothetical protein